MLFIFFKKWLAIKYDIIDAKNAPKLRESDVHYLYNSNNITLLLAQKRKIIVSADINITVKDLCFRDYENLVRWSEIMP